MNQETLEPEELENNTENMINENPTSENQDVDNEQVNQQEPVQVKEENKDWKDSYLRLVAEFDNYKKRTTKERIELFGSANKELMSVLLPVLDDFERAFKNASEVFQATEDYKGFKLIHHKMADLMGHKGLKAMESTIGKGFDVETMEAITNIPAPTEELKGKVIDEVERGYELNGKILRYAKVVVGE
jgi:molecular chaperone GrpE